MRVHGDLIKAIAFIGTDAGGTFVPYGTAVVTNYAYKGLVVPLLVTAAHVVSMIPGESVAVRMNRTDGTLGVFRISKAKTLTHPQPENDISILSFVESGEIFDYRYLMISRQDVANIREAWPFDVGDEVSTVGLYTSHYGDVKNVPVVRTGNIAMMPGEPVLTSSGYARAYLVEVRSLAGLSGSPVFCNVPMLHGGTGHQVVTMDAPRYGLIGVMVGYHLVSGADDQIVGDGEGPSLENKNTGLAVVVPIEAALEILESETSIERLDQAVILHLAGANFRRSRQPP